jgi:hypothetical protein
MEQRDLRRVSEIFRRAQAGVVTVEEKRELREILGYYSDRAWDLPWWALLDVADYTIATSPVDASTTGP